LDALSRLRSGDRPVSRHDEDDMPAALGEEQVTGQEPAEENTPAHAALVPARARDRPPDRLVGRVHQPGAVEARGARRTAVAVEDADLAPREGNDLARRQIGV